MDEPEYLPLSWLSQIAYCPRRAGLLLNERLWVENADTAKGRAEHTRVHTQRVEKRGDRVNLYEFTVFSDRLFLLGKCDCVEAYRDDSGCHIPAVDFPVRLYPIEYKHGTVREEEEYSIQLCTQAMCMEEMFHTSIPEGALFYIFPQENDRSTGCSAPQSGGGVGAGASPDSHGLGGPSRRIYRQVPPLLSE